MNQRNILIILIGPDEQLYFSFIGQICAIFKIQTFPQITEAKIAAQSAKIVSNLKQKPKKKKMWIGFKI